MSQGALPLGELALRRGAAAVKVLGYGAHRMWFSREQEALQTVQLREREVSQSFHICSFCSSSGKCLLQKKPAKRTKIFC